jgi:hypothetical protein
MTVFALKLRVKGNPPLPSRLPKDSDEKNNDDERPKVQEAQSREIGQRRNMPSCKKNPGQNVTSFGPLEKPFFVVGGELLIPKHASPRRAALPKSIEEGVSSSAATQPSQDF